MADLSKLAKAASEVDEVQVEEEVYLHRILL